MIYINQTKGQENTLYALEITDLVTLTIAVQKPFYWQLIPGDSWPIADDFEVVSRILSSFAPASRKAIVNV